MRQRSLRRRRTASKQSADLDITAFMNLMVVLVPFLLIMAVFSRMSVLQLQLPGESGEASVQAQTEDKATLALTITVRADSLVVGDKKSSQEIARIPYGKADSAVARKQAYKQALDKLGEQLVALKRQYPDVSAAAVLMEEDIPYQTLVAVMDRVRETSPEQLTASADVPRVLFPHIAIGDAPMLPKSNGEGVALSDDGRKAVASPIRELGDTYAQR
ncbi:MAG: ExbD/TolR family protein [bacterium]